MNGDASMSEARSYPPVAGRPARLVVLVSGRGTNLQALLDACADPAYGCRVVAVGADRPCEAVERGRAAGAATFVVRLRDYSERSAWDAALADRTAAHRPDLVVCAGFLKLLGPRFLAAFEGRTVNTHNALLPAFPGTHAPADALAAGVKLAGATLFVIDPGVDTGQILAQVAVPVLDSDNADSLLGRIQVAERRQLVESVGRMAREGWRVEGRRARFGAA